MSDYWLRQRHDDAFFALHGSMPGEPAAGGELPRDPWDLNVTLQFFDTNGQSVDVEAKLYAASWMEAVSGWQLGGLLATTVDLSEVKRVDVAYPGHVGEHAGETVNLAEPPARHARTGDPRGVFTTFRIAGEPTWCCAKAQHEAMLQQMRDEGFSFIGDEEGE